MKYLIIRFSPIGDIVLASPVIRSLRKAFPTAEIHFVTDNSCRGAVEFNPSIDKLHVLAYSHELLLEELKIEDYDLLIDLQGNSKSTVLCSALDKKTVSVNHQNFLEKLLTTIGIRSIVKRKLPDHYFHATRSLGLVNDGKGLDYFIPTREETTKKDIPASHHAGYIACAIDGAALQWQYWKELCAQLDHPIILIGNKTAAAAGKEIATTDQVKIYNACGKFSLNEMADLIRKSKMLVGPDGDMIPVATAFNIPVICLREKNTRSSNPYYGEAYLAGNGSLPYDVLSAGKATVSEVIAAVKKRL